MEQDKPKLSVEEALREGHRRVYGPVTIIYFATLPVSIGISYLIVNAFGREAGKFAMVASCLTGWCLGWLWWSYSVPKWRLWAYERVDNIPRLKREAVRTMLTWPDGWIFEKTEIKSAAHAARERELDGRGRK